MILLSIDKWRCDVERRRQRGRGRCVRLRCGSARTELSSDLHRWMGQQRLRHLAVNQRSPILDPDRHLSRMAALMKSRLFPAIPTFLAKSMLDLLAQDMPISHADGPSVVAIATSPPSGLEEIGAVITLKLAMSEVVTVAGGTPTLTLNDGGIATYAGGSGTDALTFSYTVAAGQNTAALAATAANLNGATITDSGGNAANLSLSGLPQAGPQIDTVLPAVTAVALSSTGVLEAGGTTTLTLNMSEPVTVSGGGTPTLTLNDGGTATYAGGSGSDALTFTYTAAVGQTTSSLAATAVNLNGATITNANGNANLSLSGLTQSGPQVAAASARRPLRLTQTTPPVHILGDFVQRHIDDVESQRSHYSGR